MNILGGSPESPGSLTAGSAIVLFLGMGALCAACGRDRLCAFGETLASYMTFALVGAVVLFIAGNDAAWRAHATSPDTGMQYALLAVGLFTLAIAALAPRVRALAIALALASVAAAALFVLPIGPADFRSRAGLGLLVSAALIAGGAYGLRRTVLVAGWTGFALVVGHLTWFGTQSLRERALFLALAGLAAIAAALALRQLQQSRARTP